MEPNISLSEILAALDEFAGDCDLVPDRPAVCAFVSVYLLRRRMGLQADAAFAKVSHVAYPNEYPRRRGLLSWLFG